jgi:hypothetical protein
MRGGRWGFGSVGVLYLLILGGCGGDRGKEAPVGEAGQAPAAADTTGLSDTARGINPDSGVAVAPRDTGLAAPKPAPAARDSTAKKVPPAPKPAAPAPKPTAPAAPKPATPSPAPAAKPSDTSAVAAPDTAQASPSADAPLRDAYHQAPRDTVTQVVYDGWKQFNLNCARCHGEDVQGTTIAPHLVESLKPDGPIPTKELFMQTVCAGRPEKGMPSWCQLGLEMGKIEAIYSYVKGRSEGKIHQGRPAVKQ